MVTILLAYDIEIFENRGGICMENNFKKETRLKCGTHDAFLTVEDVLKSLKGYTISHRNESEGIITATHKMSLLSWGEIINISIIDSCENETLVCVSSTDSVTPTMDINIHIKNVNLITSEVLKRIKREQPETLVKRNDPVSESNSITKIILGRRTLKETEVYGGEVKVSLNGRYLCNLELFDKEIEIEPGIYKIKMSKTHDFGSEIGMAEIDLEIKKGEELILTYIPPFLANQIGSIEVREYKGEQSENDLNKEKDTNIEMTQQQYANNYVLYVFFSLIGMGLIYLFLTYVLGI